MGRVLSIEQCAACEGLVSAHRVNGVWVGCRRDRVIGRDQHVIERRLRIANLKQRVLKVRPFGIGA